MLPGMFVPTKPKLVPPTLTWVSYPAQGGASGTSITFPAVTMPTGLMICVLTGRSANFRSITSITIGGVAATIHRTSTQPEMDRHALFSLEVQAGSKVIVVYFDGAIGTSSGHAVGVWSLTGQQSVLPVGITDVPSTHAARTSIPLTLDLPERSVSVYGIHHSNTEDTWTNATERNYSLPFQRCSWADKGSIPSALPGHTVTCAFGSSVAWGVAGVWA